MIGIVQAVQARVRRSVACQRPGTGASSRRRNSKNCEAVNPGVARLVVTGIQVLWVRLLGLSRSRARDRYDCRRPDTEAVVGIFHLNPDRKALRQTHPVQITWHLWQADRTRSVLGNDGPPQTDDLSLESFPTFKLQIDFCRRSLLNMLELCFAEIRDDIPSAC